MFVRHEKRGTWGHIVQSHTMCIIGKTKDCLAGVAVAKAAVAAGAAAVAVDVRVATTMRLLLAASNCWGCCTTCGAVVVAAAVPCRRHARKIPILALP